jgi:hypothetical protein
MDPLLVVTIAALVLALAMALVAWRVVRDERRRSEARIAALAAEIHRLDGVRAHDLPLHPLTSDPPVVMTETPLPRRALATAIGAGAVVVAGVAAILVLATVGADPVASGSGAEETPRTRQSESPSPAAAPSQTLELLSLTHEREQDRLVVRGAVRNPGAAWGAGHLTAVVLLFNAEGGFLTSGRAEVTRNGLPAGADVRFVVTVPDAADVGRYRVSFRSDDRVVPHVDRRKS